MDAQQIWFRRFSALDRTPCSFVAQQLAKALEDTSFGTGLHLGSRHGLFTLEAVISRRQLMAVKGRTSSHAASGAAEAF